MIEIEDEYTVQLETDRPHGKAIVTAEMWEQVNAGRVVTVPAVDDDGQLTGYIASVIKTGDGSYTFSLLDMGPVEDSEE